MRDQHGGQAQAFLNRADFMAHLQADACVQVGQGLVQQQDLGFHRQSPAQGHALALTAGQLGDRAIFKTLQVQHLQQRQHTGFDLLAWHLAQFQTVAYVLHHVHVRPQGVGLKHHRHVPAFGWLSEHVAALHINAARLGLRKAGNRAQQGGLAAARCAQQGHELPLIHVQVDALEHLVVAVGDPQATYRDHRLQLHETSLWALYRHVSQVGVDRFSADCQRHCQLIVGRSIGVYGI